MTDALAFSGPAWPSAAEIELAMVRDELRAVNASNLRTERQRKRIARTYDFFSRSRKRIALEASAHGA